jgi:hypothetical protein
LHKHQRDGDCKIHSPPRGYQLISFGGVCEKGNRKRTECGRKNKIKTEGKIEIKSV